MHVSLSYRALARVVRSFAGATGPVSFAESLGARFFPTVVVTGDQESRQMLCMRHGITRMLAYSDE